MASVKYTIVNGGVPFKVELIPSSIPANMHNSVGQFEFLNVPNGSYVLTITDGNECVFEEQITVDPSVTTTTTTQIPSNSIVVGQTNDTNVIFNEDGTNRDSHYSGYPDVNTSTIYLWFKTYDGFPITNQKTLQYSLIGDSGTTFSFNSLSDEIHCEVIENINNAPSISGNIILKSGFIETYFEYTYMKNPLIPDYTINLTTIENIFYNGLELTGGTNQYGITYNTNNNIIMKF
jgi:hypothetical protein